jgi:berberine-like enzyme
MSFRRPAGLNGTAFRNQTHEMHEHVEIESYRAPGDAGFPAAARRLSRMLHGAVHLPGDEAYDEQRRPLYPAIDPRPAMVAEACGAADVRTAVVAAALRQHATGGAFLNFLADPARTRKAYTSADYLRLREVKRVYDPDNVFRLNHNIPPALS